jgi:23S rRNA (uracil1939-C5)-methyltransferase
VTRVELRTTSIAVGGEAVAREASGRVVFVGGALPQETVLVELTDEKQAFARGWAVEVLSPSPDRVDPPCPHVLEGCGGCDWQHVSLDAQTRLRVDLVREVLARNGGLPGAHVEATPALGDVGLRTTVRGTVDADGRFALRRRRSHDPIAVDGCSIAHPAVRSLIDDGRFPPGAEVTIRVGARTGERLVVVSPSAAGTVVPDDVLVVGDDQLQAGHRAWIHDEVAGRRWRISARSFFQASPEGAESLITAAASYLGDAPADGRLVDLCCGVGLFAGALGTGRSITAVERSASSVADARHNLADLDARIIKVALARWRPSPAEVVVADPARRGLGAEGVRAVVGTGAGTCVLVSCDPAALGRDAAALVAAGYEHIGSTVVDLFAHASHIEVVSGFRLGPKRGTARG